MKMDHNNRIPEIEYISLSIHLMWSGDRRLDGETYLMPGFLYRHEIETATDYVPLSDLADVWQPSRLKGIQVSADKGLPFLTATQVFDIRPMPRKWISASKTPNLDQRYVEPGWILVTCSGTVGDAIISYKPHTGIVVSHDLLRVVPRKEGLTGYLYAFLRTRYGRELMRASRYGNIIKHLEPEHLQQVPVPLLGDEVLEVELQSLIKQVFVLRDEAYWLLIEAERRFEAELGHPDEPEPEDGYTIQASSMFSKSRRLDGYAFNPTAKVALKVLQISKQKIEPLSEVVEDIFGVPRFKHVYNDKGIPYLDSEDLFKINPELTKFIPHTAKKNAKSYYVKKGWLLMACSGQLYGLNGSVILANEWHEHKIVSNHVIRIIPGGVRSGYLQIALGHPTLGQPLVLRCAFGTSVPEIPPEEIRLFPVIRLDESVENEIADMVERASELRLKADEIENRAIANLEQEIAKAIKQRGMI